MPSLAVERSDKFWSWSFHKRWWVSDGYLWDWITAIVIIIINATVPLGDVMPANRYFQLDDPTLSYPMEESTISGTVLNILVFLVPAVLVSLNSLRIRSFADWHHAVLTWVEGYAIASGFKRWINLVGVYRPMMLAALATNDGVQIERARESYPSGHSTYMFWSMTTLSLYMLGKMRLLREPSVAQFPLAFVCLWPIILAAFVAITRLYDYAHAPADINAGCFIGVASAIFSYFLNFPSLFDLHCDKARLRRQNAGVLETEDREESKA